MKKSYLSWISFVILLSVSIFSFANHPGISPSKALIEETNLHSTESLLISNKDPLKDSPKHFLLQILDIEPAIYQTGVLIVICLLTFLIMPFLVTIFYQSSYVGIHRSNLR